MFWRQETLKINTLLFYSWEEKKKCLREMPHQRMHHIEWEWMQHQHSLLAQQRRVQLCPSKISKTDLFLLKVYIKTMWYEIWEIQTIWITHRLAFGSAPCSRSSVTHAAWPPAAAKISGVVESYKLIRNFVLKCNSF